MVGNVNLILLLSEGAPKSLKRKKWFDKLRGGKEGDGG